MIMYSDLSDVTTCFAFVSDVIVRESSESGCPLAVIVKPLYHPNGLLLTSYPRFARSCSRVFRTLRAASPEARLVERCAYGYTITRLVFIQPSTSSIAFAAFSATLVGWDSSVFSIVQNATSPSFSSPLFDPS